MITISELILVGALLVIINLIITHIMLSRLRNDIMYSLPPWIEEDDDEEEHTDNADWWKKGK